MQKYIGFGFVILCFAVLAGIVGILGYQFHLSKEKVDISTVNANINNSNKTTKSVNIIAYFLSISITILKKTRTIISNFHTNYSTFVVHQ